MIFIESSVAEFVVLLKELPCIVVALDVFMMLAFLRLFWFNVNILSLYDQFYLMGSTHD